MKRIVAIPILALGLSAASAQAIDYQMPFIAPIFCQDYIQQPKDASGHYRSEDCSTVFALPPQHGSLDIKMMVHGMLDKDCDAYEKNLDRLSRLRDNMEKLTDALAKPGISKSEIERLTSQVDVIQKSIDNIATSIDTMAAISGADAKVSLAMNLPEFTWEYQRINQDAFRRKINFQAVPIAESYVSINAVRDTSGRYRNAVVASSIPNLSIRGVESAPGSSSAIMNGAVSGQLQLSLDAICGFRKAKGVKSVNDLRMTADELEAYMPANVTYSVPVLTSYGYESELIYESAVKQIFDLVEKKATKFTVHQISNLILNGNIDQFFKWNFYALELQNRGVSEKDIYELGNSLREDVLTDSLKQLLEAMTAIGALERLPIEVLKAPEPGTEYDTYYRQVCKKKFSVGFTHVGYQEKCEQQPYQVPRLVSGSAEQVNKQLRNLLFKTRQQVQYRQPIYRTHTSTFKYQVTK